MMNTIYLIPLKSRVLFLFLSLTVGLLSAQNDGSTFWNNVRFGGGLGIGFGNGTFSGSISPSAIYDFNEYFSMGPSLIFSYQSSDFFKSTLYGASWITLAQPIPEIQLSAELEQLRVNQEIELLNSTVEDDFWNTALFIGAGYNTGFATLGVRYNVLYKEGESVYAEAWSPFVRVYF